MTEISAVPAYTPRMIPRHAELHALDGSAPPPPRPAPRELDAAQVKAAFEVFYAEAVGRIDTSQQLALIQARQRFLESIDLKPTPD